MGRRAVVTGAASGIGKAAAERLLREGVAVVAVDRDAAGLEPLAGAGATALVADLADERDRERVVAAGDGVDYLVATHGWTGQEYVWKASDFMASVNQLNSSDFPAAPKVVEDADTFERRWMVTVRFGDGAWRVTNYQEFEG